MNDRKDFTIIKLFSGLIIAFIFLFILEFALRFFMAQENPLSTQNINFSYFLFDSDLLFRLKPNHLGDFSTKSRFAGTKIIVDNNGFRVPYPDYYQNLSSRKSVILCLGDSVTYGWGIKAEDSYPVQLQNLILEEKPESSCLVLNAGVPNYSSFQGLKYIEKKLLKYNLIITIISFGLNDRLTAHLSDSEQYLKNKENSVVIPKYISHLAIYEVLRSLIKGEKVVLTTSEDLVLPPEPIPPPGSFKVTFDENTLPTTMPILSEGLRYRVSLEEFENNLREIAKLIKEKNGLLVFFDQPLLKPTRNPNHPYNLALRKIAQEMNIPLIDMASIVDQYRQNQDPSHSVQDLYIDYCHFSALGCKILAQEIWTLIKNKNLLKENQSEES